jgi:hypothetical protein
MAIASNNRKVGRLKRNQRLTVYWVSSCLVLTGLVWLYYFYFVRVVDQFGFENPHPLQGYLLVGHALFALPSVWIFGFLWHIHVKPGWRAKAKRLSGGTIWSLVLWMILSGYSLYYIGDDAIRGWLSLSHWVAGGPALVVFFLHIRQIKNRLNSNSVAIKS